MARTFHDRPSRLQYEERPWLPPLLKDASRTRFQRAVHKQDRAAVRQALLTGSERSLPQRRRIDHDMH